MIVNNEINTVKIQRVTPHRTAATELGLYLYVNRNVLEYVR
jgi:hypothetical protein